MHCRHKLRRTRLLGRGSFLLFLVIFIFPYVMSVSFHKFSKAKEIIKKEKDQRFANAGCSFGLSYQEAQSCLHQHNVGLFVVHISLVWLLFCLNLVFPCLAFFSVWIWCLNLWFCAARSKIQSWGAFDLSGERRGGKSGSVNVQKIALAASSPLSCHRKNRGAVLSMSNLFIWTTPILGLLCHQNGLKEIFFFMWRC